MSTTALLVGTAIVTGLQVAGSISQANAQSSAAKYNASVAEQNAKQAQALGYSNEERLRERSRRLISSQRAALAKAGVDLGEGSPLLVQSEQAANNELDILYARYDSNMQASQYRSQAALSRMEARSAKTQGYTKAGASLLSGISSMGSMSGGSTSSAADFSLDSRTNSATYIY